MAYERKKAFFSCFYIACYIQAHCKCALSRCRVNKNVCIAAEMCTSEVWKPSTTQRRWGTTVRSFLKYVELAVYLSAIFGVLPHKFLIRTWKDSPEFVLHLCPPACAKGVLPGNGFLKFLASGQQDRNLTCAAKRAKAGLPHKGPASEPPELCTPHGCPAMSTGNSGLLEACPFLALLQRSLWPQPLPKGRQRRALRCWDL